MSCVSATIVYPSSERRYYLLRMHGPVALSEQTSVLIFAKVVATYSICSLLIRVSQSPSRNSPKRLGPKVQYSKRIVLRRSMLCDPLSSLSFTASPFCAFLFFPIFVLKHTNVQIQALTCFFCSLTLRFSSRCLRDLAKCDAVP